ncbi:caspase family protein [Actinospica durhamensis]|uniref:Caspase family protein n=1 Tax=Actinospica durhamensis TaxID=1508375 RepID=A0A941ESJ4_9ACTN|nr:caspase family protein [Actinospica durhamensis]MBR7837272.1 caspase family protein [Actinospica durhamensis]
MSADQSSWRAPQRHALLVATDEYDDADWAQLRSPAADAEGLAAALADPSIGDFAVTTVLNAPYSTIRTSLEEFLSDRTRDDFLLLYFSCHGYREDGEFYFAARDTLKRRLQATGVDGGFVHRLLKKSAADRVVVVLDCCYSGAFPKGAKGTTLTTDLGHLAEIVSGTGRAIITASGSIESAYEDTDTLTGSDPVPSIFTEALIHGLRSGLADLDGDGHVAVNEWFEYATARLLRRGAVQTPHMWNADVVGRLFVARNPFFRAPLPAIPAAAAPVLGGGEGNGVLGRLATFGQVLPGGKALTQAVIGLVYQVRTVLMAARLPSAWWALLGSLQELADDHDADRAVSQLFAALRRLEQDPTAVYAVSDALETLEALVRDPGFAGALGQLVRALEIAVNTGSDLLKRVATPELYRRSYGLAHEFATRFLVEPDPPAPPESAPGVYVAPAPWYSPSPPHSDDAIAALYRFAHAVRGFAGHEALREAISAFAASLAPRRPMLSASSAQAERLADQVLELTLSTRRWVEGPGAAFIRDAVIGFCDDLSKSIRDARKNGTHATELDSFLNEATEFLTDAAEALTGPDPISAVTSLTESLRDDPISESDYQEMFSDLADLVGQWIEAIDELTAPEE